MRKLNYLAKLKNYFINHSREWKFNVGATVIEIIVVIAIILLIASTVAIAAISLLGPSREAIAKNQIESFKIAIETYYLKYRMYPTQEQGLQALRTKPVIEPIPENWDRPILDKELPKDPWGRDYKYIVPGPLGDPYGIISYGADGVEGGDGENKDIKSWE